MSELRSRQRVSLLMMRTLCFFGSRKLVASPASRQKRRFQRQSSRKYSRKYLKKGDKGKEVTKWQKFLNWVGYNCGKADGVFGDKTVGATKSFQYKNGLTADGFVGANTISKAKETKK